MFLFRWIKKLVLLVLIVTGTLYIADYNWNGKPVREHFKGAYQNGIISEGLKDISTWLSDIFKFGKKAATDNITEKDKTALEAVIKNELKDNIMKLKEKAEKTETGDKK